MSTTPGLGHVLPMLSLARELVGRGHELRWLLGEGNVNAVEAAGIDTVVAGMAVPDRLAQFARLCPDLGSSAPQERRATAFSIHFAALAAPAMIDPLRHEIRAWRPDVVVHEAAELAAPLAAAAAGLPSVCQGFGEVVPEFSVRRAGEELAPLWRAAGLLPDIYAGCYRGLYVDIYPPSLTSADTSHIPIIQRRRPALGVPAAGDLVYVTFGTVFNQIEADFRAAVDAAAATADRVLVTVGRAGNPEDLEPVPANVSVERFVPQAEVLPQCAAVICHGGSGTVLASLAHGVPLLCLPRAADQFANASNVARADAGIALVGPQVTDIALRSALDSLLNESGHREAAGVLAAEIASMPSDADVCEAIEAHAEGR